ncbi:MULTISPECIES: hypothetical protein [Clostridium]|jgi:hypothetical protein|uniref:Bacteriocin n=1 Tax=Clostridium tepidum TaxID=1962263 RepID=A0A1S9I438_9CLOT|nr:MULTISPECIES: hypothetical protein [Clostridium]MDU6877080.1 bacteriocin [Clostridium botulinum]KOY66023.1 hypothetical protein AN649_10765 [Clostridium sporogenes]MBE6055934.1 bacteriocin [Clostridium sp.]MCR1935590.1 bacteriocin [Clostridium tepidum]MDS1009356.1 bacteriocin [Clostridium sporogenes]
MVNINLNELEEINGGGKFGQCFVGGVATAFTPLAIATGALAGGVGAIASGAAVGGVAVSRMSQCLSK